MPPASRPEHNLRDSDNYDGIFSCFRVFHENDFWDALSSRELCVCVDYVFAFSHFSSFSKDSNFKQALLHTCKRLRFNIRQHNDDPNLNVYKFELCAARTISSCNEGCEICWPYLLISINISTKTELFDFFLFLPFSTLIISQ